MGNYPPAPSSKRAPPMASISSKNTRQAFFERAICNKTARSQTTPHPASRLSRQAYCARQDMTPRAPVSILETKELFSCPGQCETNSPTCAHTWKSSRTMRAPSPTYFCTSSLPMTRMKQASVLLATARASSVFPVPAPLRSLDKQNFHTHHSQTSPAAHAVQGFGLLLYISALWCRHSFG